ncbi:major facilitator superfamily domain-containing protein [Mycena rosella]|uniref:Major facilitator superfamily domain-containing protein n=1 Tax=Mycena rosella TaxID=1033263 RepID=A0AAD7G3M6_MYCRO|nr:major facilitator superfamily domain-containing protein [Mycena rosella]
MTPPARPSLSGGAPKRSALRSVLIDMLCTSAMMVNNSNNTSVSIALPTIGKELHAQEVALQWLVSAYPLSSGCLLLLFGRRDDLHAYLLGSAFLAVFTLACGFAQGALPHRMGMGGAATIPGSVSACLTFLTHCFTVRIQFGAIGMAIGGVMTQLTRYTWRSPFLLSAALSLAALIGGVVVFDPDEPSTETHSTPDIIVLLILGLILLGLFVCWEMYLERITGSPELTDIGVGAHIRATPAYATRALRARARGRVGIMYVATMLEFGAFTGWTFWVQLYYQKYVGYSAVRTVVRLVPMFCCGMLCNALVTLIVGRVPVIWLIVSGLTLTSLSVLLFALIDPAAPYWEYGFPAAVCSVVGADFVFPTGTLFVAGVSAPGEQSVAGGVFQTMTQLSSSLGVTISTIVFNHIKTRDAMWTYFAFGMRSPDGTYSATLLSLVFSRG